VVVGSVKGTDGGWDYASINPATGRFYLAQDGVTVSGSGGARGKHLVDGKRTHGVIAVDKRGTMAVGDAGSHSVRFFDGKTGKVETDVSVGGSEGDDPDAMLFEPKTNTVVAVLGGAGRLVFIDAASHLVTGKVALKGKLEFAAADGTGMIYVNEETRSKIAFVDVAARKLVKEATLAGCESPTGLAYDDRDSLLAAACENSLAEFVST
jgi:DNA-binding beta-propeller fold protein YncE